MSNAALKLTFCEEFQDNATDNMDNTEKRNKLTEQYMPFAQRIAKKVIKEFGLPKNNFEDYLSSAYLGLIQAAERYDDKLKKKFELYAYPRVRGAIIDSIRRSSQRTGGAYKRVKALDACNQSRLRYEEELENVDQDAGLNTLLNMVSDEALSIRLVNSIGIDDLENISDAEATPEEALILKEESILIKEIINELPEKMRLIVEGFYFNDMLFNQALKQVPGMSKSWASRLHTKALEVIKERYLETKNDNI